LLRSNLCPRKYALSSARKASRESESMYSTQNPKGNERLGPVVGRRISCPITLKLVYSSSNRRYAPSSTSQLAKPNYTFARPAASPSSGQPTRHPTTRRPTARRPGRLPTGRPATRRPANARLSAARTSAVAGGRLRLSIIIALLTSCTVSLQKKRYT
jgi:hypothetical protein